MANSLFPFLAWIPSIKARMLKIHFDSLSKMQHIDNIPILFISGDIDSFVPTVQTHQLYNAKPDDKKELIIVQNGNHNDTWLRRGPQYLNDLKTFFEKCQKGDD